MRGTKIVGIGVWVHPDPIVLVGGLVDYSSLRVTPVLSSFYQHATSLYGSPSSVTIFIGFR